MKFSWIIAIISAYFLSVLIYMFQDAEGDFWTHYFWLDMSIICLSGFLFNFMPDKTPKELSFILFFAGVKILNILYYITGIILNKQVWMDVHIAFLIFMGASGFIGLIFYHVKYGKQKVN